MDPEEHLTEFQVAGRLKITREKGISVVSIVLNIDKDRREETEETCAFCSVFPKLRAEAKSHEHPLNGTCSFDKESEQFSLRFPCETNVQSNAVHYEIDGKVYEFGNEKRTVSKNASRKRKNEKENEDEIDEICSLNEDHFQRLQAAGSSLEVAFCASSVIPESITSGPDTSVFLSRMKELAKLVTSVQQKFECESCEMKTCSYFPFIEHVFRHKEARPYVCSLCESSFQTRAVMRHHLDMHGGKAPFQCEFCGKRFRNSCHMKEHRLKHTGEKPYACSFCKQSFAHKNGLKIHLQQHTGEKPYQCDSCGKLFRDQHRLRKHEKVHKKRSIKKNEAKEKVTIIEEAEIQDVAGVVIPGIESSFVVEEGQIGSMLIEISMDEPGALVEANGSNIQ